MFRRKLLLNLLILVICGTVAISIPVIVNHWSKPASADGNGQDVTLVSVFVDCTNLDSADSCVVWQIHQKRGDTIVADWDTIYASLNAQNRLDYDHANLQLTPYGLCFKGIHTPADYQNLYDTGYSSNVTYQGQTCRLQLP